MAESTIEQMGRVTYVEPTNVAFYSDGTTAVVRSNDLVLNPMEEYSIAVDLEVIVPNRKACSLAMENGEQTIMNYTSTNGTLSFLHGTDGVLTTNFTDVNPINPTDNTTECLGIESINIEYSSWMYPQVTIKFVDVRGSSVLLPEENSYSNGTGFGSVYRALFSMPSPIFKLKVKGFYGKGVTYYLAVESFNLDLDSSSGNFGIVVKFVGFMYRVYADMPMTYICLAPYMKWGKEYWNNQVANGKFKFINRNDTTSEMCTIPELRRRIANAAYSEKRISAAAKGKQVEDNTDERILTLKQIKSTYPLKDWYMTDTKAVYAVQTDLKAETIEGNIESYMQTVSGYDATYKTNFLSVFSTLGGFTKKKLFEKRKRIREYTYTYNTELKRKERKNKNNEAFLEEKDADISDYVNEVIQSGHVVTTISKLFVADGNFKSEKNFIDNEIDKHIDECEKYKEEAAKEFKEMENSALEEVLGFSPSIANVYNLIFAHMETFMEAFYTHMKTIKEKLTDNNPDRKKTTYAAITDISDDDEDVPPYPAFYKEKHHANGSTMKELIWPEKVTNGDKLDEVNFIKSILEGASLYAEDSAKADKEIEILKNRMASGVTGNQNTGGAGGSDFLAGAPSLDITNFLPLTTFDFVNKDKIENPYAWVKNADEGEMIGSSDVFEDAVIATFATRAVYYMSTNKSKKSEADTFGRLEGLNFIKAFGENYFSDRFFDFIDRYADDKRERKDANNFVKEISEPAAGNNRIWNFGTQRLFPEFNSELYFDLFENEFHGKGYYPVGKSSFFDIKRDSISGFIGTSATTLYIPESRNKDCGENRESFHMFPSRDYVNEIYKGVESMAETEERYGLSQSAIKRFKDNIDPIINNDDSRYMRSVIYRKSDNKAIGKKEMRDLFNISITERENYYIKYPTAMDEHEKDSLFDEPIYTGQDSGLSKAYLFLYAIPIKSRRWEQKHDSANGAELLSEMLREGAHYWRWKYMHDNGSDPIKTDIGGVKYKQAGPDETYVSYRYTTNNKETLKPLKEKEKGKYIGFVEPEGCTDSRKRVLRNAFIKWAENDFAKVAPFLEDVAYYATNNGKKNSVRDFKNGLDISLVTGATINLNAYKLNQFLVSLYCDAVTIFDYYAGRPTSNANFSAKDSEIKAAFRGFMDTLQKVYKKKVKSGRDAASFDAAMGKADDPFKNDDINLSTYMTVKNLYDKWFCAPLNGQDTWRIGAEKSDFNTFKYLDSFYHDIGHSLNVNITKVGEWLSNCLPTQNMQTSEGTMAYKGKSMYEFLAEVAQGAGGTLFAFPVLIGGQSTEHMASMFKTIPYIGDWETDSSTFVFLYSYKPSEHMGTDEYNDDGFEITADEVSTILGDKGENIPAFGVTYAKQNQSFFKNITLNTEQPAVTEASIMATMSIAAKGSEGVRETSLFGQDLYRVKTAYSYQCEFDMMGCSQIVPLMYFQLNNVPFWRGTYIIYKVSHQITAGDMTTHVVGTRLNKYSLPMVDNAVITQKEVASSEYGGESGSGNNVINGASNQDGEGGDKQIPPDPNRKIVDKTDFSEKNIKPDKPIICLTPAHGPKTPKSSEWFWSRKLIDLFIIPRLSKLTFYDGTSYADNIQRCNKDNMGGYSYDDIQDGISANNTGKGYGMSETRNLVKKYGSNQVISVVPHWNGGGGKYFAAYDGKTSRTYGTTKMRSDSESFGKIFREEAEKLVRRAKNNEFHEIPDGMMSGGVTKTHLLPTGAEIGSKDDHTDGACGLDCACVLTENFFADYSSNPPSGKKGEDYSGSMENLKKYKPGAQCKGWSRRVNGTCSGPYVVGEGWLLSDEGMAAIAQMHVEAIRRYIDNLHSTNYQDQNGQKTAGE